MNQTLIQRYQAGGDIYAQLAAQYGIPGADAVAAAARTGDETQVNAALTGVKNGQPLNTSTWSIFGNQLATDPLAAPLASANNLISHCFLKTRWSCSPWPASRSSPWAARAGCAKNSTNDPH